MIKYITLNNQIIKRKWLFFPKIGRICYIKYRKWDFDIQKIVKATEKFMIINTHKKSVYVERVK